MTEAKKMVQDLKYLKSGARHSANDHELGAKALEHISQAADHLTRAGFGAPVNPTGEPAPDKSAPMGVDPLAYAVLEGWDAAQAGRILSELTELYASEATQGEPDDAKLILACMAALGKFISGEIGEMQTAHAQAGQAEPAMMSADAMIFGGQVKALGRGKVGGQLARFTAAGDYDLTGDRFNAETNFGSFDTVPVYYHHGQDPIIGKRILSTAKITRNEAGLWAEAQLAMRDDYEREIYRLAEAGKLGWSSGSVAHLVERTAEGKGAAVKSWPIVEASLTPTPAEPRNGVQIVKSLLVGIDKASPDGDGPAPDGAAVSQNAANLEKDNIMTDETKALVDAVAALTKRTEELQAQLDAPALKSLPVQAVNDKAEHPFKNLGEQLFAVRDVQFGSARPEQVNKLEAAKALAIKAAVGGNELAQSEGGFLLQPEFADFLYTKTYNTGEILKRCRTMPIQSNGLKIPAIDEQSRADGSRFGGLRAYWAAEASTFQTSTPKFRNVVFELKKLTGMIYGTDELLADTVAFSKYVGDTFPLELNFKLEDAVINGLGGGLPMGILAAPSLVTVTKESGQAAATVLYSNIVKMWSRMWAGGQGPNIIQGTGGSMGATVWIINQDVMPQLFSLVLPAGVAGSAAFMPAGGLSGQPFSTLFGRPIIPVEQCATLGTVGDIILADLNQYMTVSKGGIDQAMSIHVQFVTDQTAFRFIYRIDGQPLWNTALTPYKGSNTLSPFVALATRA